MWHWTIRVCQITDMTDSISFTFRISSQIEYARLIQLFICDIPAFCILSSMYPFLEQTQWYASLWCQILSSCQCSAVVLVETDPTFLSFLPMTNKFFLQSPIPRQHLSSSPFSTTAETRCISVVGFSCTLSNSLHRYPLNFLSVLCWWMSISHTFKTDISNGMHDFVGLFSFLMYESLYPLFRSLYVPLRWASNSYLVYFSSLILLSVKVLFANLNESLVNSFVVFSFAFFMFSFASMAVVPLEVKGTDFGLTQLLISHYSLGHFFCVRS